MSSLESGKGGDVVQHPKAQYKFTETSPGTWKIGSMPVDPHQGWKAKEIQLFSFQRPHMRGFHFAWSSFFARRAASPRDFDASADGLAERSTAMLRPRDATPRLDAVAPRGAPPPAAARPRLPRPPRDRVPAPARRWPSSAGSRSRRSWSSCARTWA